MDVLDPRYGNNFIDNNGLDRTDDPAENAAVDTILELAGQAFGLLLPYSVKAEVEHPNTPRDVQRRAAMLLHSLPVQLTEPERATHDRVRALLQGNALPGKHAADAFHLVESAKYGGRYFITNDGRLLDKAPEIWAALQIQVVKPSAFLAAYRSACERRPA